MIEQTSEQFAANRFHATLKTHRLSGEGAGIWACSIDYSDRILFKCVANPEASEKNAILLLNLTIVMICINEHCHPDPLPLTLAFTQ